MIGLLIVVALLALYLVLVIVLAKFTTLGLELAQEGKVIGAKLLGYVLITIVLAVTVSPFMLAYVLLKMLLE